MSDQPYLRMVGVSKLYPESGVLANDGADLLVQRQEIHALVGENGAGKSTLMKILCGLERADRGRILLEGREVQIPSPLEAARLGIGMVHQHFRLIPEFTVAENVVLGMEPRRRGVFLHREEAVRRVREVAERYGFPLDPRLPVSSLTVGQMQLVEIIKILYREAQLLVLDEPTSVLTEGQIQSLFDTLHRLCRMGRTIILVTHKLAEVRAVSQRVTVMRGGRVVAVRATEQVGERELSRLMLGRSVGGEPPREPAAPGRVVLELRGVTLRQRGQDHPLLEGVDLEVRAGQIVGVAGVSGNGLAELEEVVSGLRRVSAGRIFHDGEEVTHLGTLELRRRGLAYVPADRLRRGASLSSSVTENLIVTRRQGFRRFGVLQRWRAERYASALLEEFSIRADPRLPVSTLSGGNIQKVILARELAAGADLILFSEPTWGLDVAAAAFIHGRILELRRRGVAVLLVSSSLEEVLRLADTVVVLHRGRVVARRPISPGLSRELIGEYMLGLPAAAAGGSRR